MKVYFQRLVGDVWICYDEQNTTGDRYVSPAKMHQVTDQLRLAREWAGNKYYSVPIKARVQGFSECEFTGTLIVTPDGKIRNFCLADVDDRGYVNNACTAFVLDLPIFPEFDEFVHDDVNDESLAK